MTSRRPSGLVFRLYLVGVVQLLTVAIAAVLIGALITRFTRRRDPPAVLAQVEALIDDSPALERTLAEHKKRGIELSLYDADGGLITSNVQPPLTAPRWRDDVARRVPPGGRVKLDSLPPPMPPIWLRAPFGPPTRHRPPPFLYAGVIVQGREGVIVARFPHPQPSALPALVAFAAGLLVIFVGAYFTARWIARPLEQVSRAARALGRGDLRARTDLRRADELGEVGSAFNEMAGRIQQLLLAEKELLANVAHELRTPLARIRVALDMASEGDAGAARASLGEIALDMAELEALIDDVLTATRFELHDGAAPSSGFPLHIEVIGARELAERAAQRFRARHPERPLTVEASDADGSIEVDPTLFRRAIDNLLENADKYTPDAGQPVLLRVAAQDGTVSFTVADRGLGIGSDDLPRVFTPFFRSERSRSRSSGGVGLGLTLTKRIVEAHAGQVELMSAGEAEGTSARITLPRAPE
jgi:two-component system, OmpR family, sensor kinase